MEFHYYLAHAYMIKSQYAQAESELLRVLSLDLNNNGARYNLGMVYINQGKLPEARKTFLDMLDPSIPKMPTHITVSAPSPLRRAITSSAAAEYKQAVELDPENGDYYALGMAYMKVRQTDDAIASFQQAQKMYNDDQDLELALADAYRAKGMTKEADAATAKAAQMK